MSAYDSKSLSQQRYSQYGHGYVTSKTHAKGAELERLLEIAQPQADWTMLDVATGGGHTALKFAPHVARVIATDLTAKMVQVAHGFIASQQIDNVVFNQTDAEYLPFREKTFDLVTCRIAAHHFPDPGLFVREGARVLKPGGLLVVQDQVVPEDAATADYVNAFEKLRDPSHHRAVSEAEWRAFFQAAGLATMHAEHIIKRHSFDQWTAIQACPSEVIALLINMLAQAPPEAATWLQAQAIGKPNATFVNHHLLIAGSKL
ncbi:MAG TPA: class I SAM-dependent methyltransferase [Anaerolineales bacterium]